MATVVPQTDTSHIDADDMSLEIFCLIWLDANTSVEDNRDTEQKLRSIINRLKKFQDVEQCQKYLEESSEHKRFVVIVSGRLGREIVPSIHKLRQVISIYIYCWDKESNEEWTNNFSKVKAVIVQLDELISGIQDDHKIQKMVEEPLSINIFTTDMGSNKSTTGLNGQFVFSQVLIECLLRLKYYEVDKKELIRRCKKQYEGNRNELSKIREFQKDYSSDKALWWYTRESFFYKTLNTVLRTKNIHLMFLFRTYMLDIYHQLKDFQAKDRLQLYRSQMISSDELINLEQCCGQFISVNSFFSTSTNEQKALSFLKRSHVTDNLKPILFEIIADPTVINTKPFADISQYSAFPNESEILFMLGSIFRLESVKRNSDDQVWIIRMVLSSDDEHDLKQVLMDMKEQLGGGETNLQTLGRLLSEMSRFDLAEKYFIRFLKQLSPDDPLLYDLYQDLGKLASQVNNLDKSMEWRQKAITLKKQNQSKSSESDSKFIERKSMVLK
ncbi:unnamed protein product [Rotaria sp. Silwood1]|nr:unnamed protein product [Rotaria sp. Silwood1]CAF1689479.1 unnamed protein product [Rotaria sp. Silwood1]CAF3766906.1 unnamed protein product [Rotaria sp. Silwood1]